MTRLLTAVALCVLLSFTAVSAKGPALDADRGAQLYREICQGCHMSAAQGARGAGAYPALARNPRLVSWEYVAVTVLNGRNAMPHFGARRTVPVSGAPELSDGEIAVVTNYLRTHFGNRYRGRASAAAVAALPHPGDAESP